jgi:hypothetical protein
MMGIFEVEVEVDDSSEAGIVLFGSEALKDGDDDFDGVIVGVSVEVVEMMPVRQDVLVPVRTKNGDESWTN